MNQDEAVAYLNQIFNNELKQLRLKGLLKARI